MDKSPKRISFEINAREDRSTMQGKYIVELGLGDGLKIIGESFKNWKYAKRTLELKVKQCLSIFKDKGNNTNRKIISCNDGTILLVEYFGQNDWGYSILSKDRIGPSCSRNHGYESYNSALAGAFKHADLNCSGYSWSQTV